MQQQDIHRFLERYFKANNCDITANETGTLTAKLTVELDKQLMNRPFYWHYVEKTGAEPQPATLTFFTEQKENEKGEFLHFGSPRLHQIFQSAKKQSSFLRLYEDNEGNEGKYNPLTPWLNLNVKISYVCDRKKDVLLSLGLHLISGQLVQRFFEKMQQKQLTPKLPDYSFPVTALIKPQSGLARLKRYIDQTIHEEDHTWADDAKKRWQEDLTLLEQFYEDRENDDVFANEKEALKIQYEPKITVEVINGGLFYLSQ